MAVGGTCDLPRERPNARWRRYDNAVPPTEKQETTLSQPSSFPFQRARRPLPLTVKSVDGLAEGEVWFIEGDEITFWCSEQLALGRRFEMRVDVKTTGRNVDLFVEASAVMPGREAGVARGYLHRGLLVVRSDEEEERLMRRFWQLNPEHAPARDSLPPTRNSTGAGNRRARRLADSAEDESAERAALLRRAREAVERATSREPKPAETARAAPLPEPSKRRRRRRRRATKRPRPPKAAAPVVPGPPRPPMERDQRQKPEVAPGEPVSVLLSYSHREVMQADAVLRDEVLWLFVGHHPLLWEEQPVDLVLQLPAGNFVQLTARVHSLTAQYCLLEAGNLHVSVLAHLRTALGF